jgi:VWFA-related protein
MDRSVFLSSLILCSLLLPVGGQQQPQPPSQQSAPKQQNEPRDDEQDIVRINTNLVQVDAVVTKDGKQVTDLKAEDFEIFEDGRRQTITNFSYISNVPSSLPPVVAKSAGRNVKNTPVARPPVPPAVIKYHDERRTVALMVDDLGMSFESIARVRKQIGKFLDELAPRDLMAIIRTGGEVGALQQFTNDKRLLRGAVEHLRWNPCSRVGIQVLAPERIGGYESRPLCSNSNMSGTLDAIKFVLEGMRDLPGRKSMIMFSDNLPVQQQEPLSTNFSPQRENPKDRVDDSGLDPSFSFRAELGRVAELAIRASVVIYSVDTQGLQTTGITAADEISNPQQPKTPQKDPEDPYLLLLRRRSRALLIAREGAELIARQTGGFLIRNSNDYGIQRVMEDQQGYYLIGFCPSEDTFDRKFHHLKAKVKGSGLSVRTRAGFYGFTNEQTRPAEPMVKDPINRALISPFNANEITVHLTTIFVDEPSQGSLLRSFLYFDPRDLTFTEEADGWRVANLKLRGFLFGDNGRVIDQLSRAGTLRLRGPAYDRALREGIVYGFDIPVKQPGAYQFRVAVSDVGSSHIGTAGEFVEIPDLHSGRMFLSGIVVRDAADLPQDGNEAAVRRSSPRGAPEASAGPAVRRFRQGADLIFAYAVYNARLDETKHLPQLSTQTRVFRDGQPIFNGEAMPLDPAGQSDLQRIGSASRLQLGAALLPGEYVLQIIVTDSLGKEKLRTATQWIDFEVFK